MNKKFFAALASATMAFSATGSLAVFAQDFEAVDESNVVKPGEVRPNPTKLAFNKDNFGALVDGKVTFKKANGTDTVTLTKDTEYDTTKYEEVASIELQDGFDGEIKGLEYFTELVSFDDSAMNTADKKVANEALDFSANTKLASLTVKKAPELAEIKLPKPEITKDEKEVYHLTTLDLEGTKLSKLDLSAQEELVKEGGSGSITVSGNKNLKEITLKVVNSAEKAELATLDLSNNALETVNLNNYTITTLDLSGNHIGALNLSKTTATNATLTGQTFYVYEKAANVNLKEAFADLDVDYVEPATGGKFDKKTGVLDLNAGANTTYTYETKVGGTTSTELEVALVPANPMNRLYNPNSGEHFYTVDVKEKEALVALGWQDEGYGWVAPVKEANDKEVYRLYNPNAGDHHYTMEVDERDTLEAYGWKYEGIGWYSAEDTSHNDKKVPVYRQYNPYANGAGSHNYTPDKAENNYLVSLGWIYEGTAWTALQ